MKNENTVSPEVAENEYALICDFFDVEHDEGRMDDEDRADLSRVKSKIIGAIKAGRLAVHDSGQPTYTTKAGTAMTFKEPTGATLLVKTRGEDPQRKMFAIVQDLTSGVSSPGKWSSRDTGVLMALVSLFISELQ